MRPGVERAWDGTWDDVTMGHPDAWTYYGLGGHLFRCFGAMARPRLGVGPGGVGLAAEGEPIFQPRVRVIPWTDIAAVETYRVFRPRNSSAASVVGVELTLDALETRRGAMEAELAIRTPPEMLAFIDVGELLSRRERPHVTVNRLLFRRDELVAAVARFSPATPVREGETIDSRARSHDLLRFVNSASEIRQNLADLPHRPPPDEVPDDPPSHPTGGVGGAS